MGTIEGGPSTMDDRAAYIFAGYPAEMKEFLNVNAGLKRRITHVFRFSDYTYVELVQIANVMAKKNGFLFHVSAHTCAEKLRAVFDQQLSNTKCGTRPRNICFCSCKL